MHDKVIGANNLYALIRHTGITIKVEKIRKATETQGGRQLHLDDHLPRAVDRIFFDESGPDALATVRSSRQQRILLLLAIRRLFLSP